MFATQTIHTVTFAVDDVSPASEPLPDLAYKDAIAGLSRDPKRPFESWSQSAAPLAQVAYPGANVHSFLLTANRAYAEHRPLVLSPDMLWLLILQGFALHVNANAEALRHRFVKHEGKQVIEIRRDEFVKGFVGNDWEGVFAEFSAKIQEHIGAETHCLLVPNFSTTGIVEKAAMEVALMDTLQSYFVYAVKTMCGIPFITLEGTPEDWEQVREGAEKLAAFDLDWWIPYLLPLLDQCVLASRGKEEKDFWQNFYKLRAHGSGDQTIHGHIVNLFPYFGSKRPSNEQLLADVETYFRQTRSTEPQIKAGLAAYKARLARNEKATDTLRRNPCIGSEEGHGFSSDSIASMLSSAPFLWNDYGTVYPMEFVAGFFGATQDAETQALRPAIGWAIRDGVA